MLEWLAQNAGNIVVCSVIAAAVAAVIAGMIKKRRRGESSCGCGCAGCPMSDSCSKKE